MTDTTSQQMSEDELAFREAIGRILHRLDEEQLRTLYRRMIDLFPEVYSAVEAARARPRMRQASHRQPGRAQT